MKDAEVNLSDDEIKEYVATIFYSLGYNAEYGRKELINDLQLELGLAERTAAEIVDELVEEGFLVEYELQDDDESVKVHGHTSVDEMKEFQGDDFDTYYVLK